MCLVNQSCLEFQLFLVTLWFPEIQWFLEDLEYLVTLLFPEDLVDLECLVNQ